VKASRVAGYKGSARVFELIFPVSPAPDPKGWTGGPPNVQTEGGFRKGGPTPTCSVRVVGKREPAAV
jgi:hypothetical protein